MNIPIFNLFRYEKTEAVKDIVKNATPTNEFFLLNAVASVVAVAGLFKNNVPLIMGSMLIAPLLSPLFAAAMGQVTRDWELLLHSLRAVAISSSISIVLATVASAVLIWQGYTFPNEGYLATIQPTGMLFIISFLSGVAAATAVTNERLDSVLPGIAISVSLIPPLAATGMHLAYGNFSDALFTGALYTGSVCAVFGACLLVFTQMEFQTEKDAVEDQRESEEKKQKDRSTRS